MRIKKSLLSVLTVGAVAATALYATNAFFSDTETSTGNTLTAGAIDLQIDSTAHYAGMVCTVDGEVSLWVDEDANPENNPRPELLGQPCEGSWALKDLAQGDTFFALSDIKPGDFGENTISIHIADNDAWLCADVSLTENDDNSSTEPELSDGDVAENVGDPFDGELAQNVRFTAWLDQGVTPGFDQLQDDGQGDNIWQGEESEPLLFTNVEGPASDVLGGVTYALADSTTPGGPMTGGETSYLGLQWCHGVMTVDTTASTISCDGSTLNNLTQTDSFVADVTFRAVQSRNNEDFVCTPPEVQRPLVGAALGGYTQPIGDACDVTVDDSGGANFTTIQAAINDAETTNGETICVASGTYPEDVSITKEVELAGAGAATTFVVGQTPGEAGAMVILANNVTVRGFDIVDTTGGIAALRISGAHSGILINSNRLSSATGGANAFLTDGGQSGVMLSNNEFVGNSASQLAYVNGTASVAVASSNVDFFENSFSGTIVSGGVVLGNESTGSDITENEFASTLTSTYAILENWEDDANINFNNFNGIGGIKVRDSDAGAGPLDAENNWWGAAAPAGHTAGDVDDDPKESSAFPEN